ncbi:hypothetical protein ACWDZ4_13780 [Streptomyces sp. NPDC003016]
MSQEKSSWHPGEIVSAGGVYACDCDGEHHWSTEAKGHRVPPLPSGCTAEFWKVQKPAYPENYLG